LYFRLIFATLTHMKKAFKYRIYPTSEQESIFVHNLDICRELYNAALQERSDAYKRAGISITYSMQQNQLPEIKKSRTDLKDVHSQVLRATCKVAWLIIRHPIQLCRGRPNLLFHQQYSMR
jgi:transposase